LFFVLSKLTRLLFTAILYHQDQVLKE